MDSNIKSMNKDELIINLFKTQFDYCYKNTNGFITFYESKKNRLICQIYEHTKEEPCKFFKKTHKKWQDELDSLNKDLDDTYDKLMEEYKELEKLLKIASN